MKKRSLLISLATLSLLFSGLVACGGNKPADESKAPEGTSEVAPDTSEAAKPSSEAPKPSSNQPSSQAQPSSEVQPVHEHSYAKVGENVKNADGKDVFLMECADKDDKYIGIAFNDYSALNPTTALTDGTAKYSSVTVEDVWLIDKEQTVTWKVDVDKAISGAKLVFGVVMTSSSHSTQGYDENGTVKYSFKVNNGEFVNWDLKGLTYGDYGLSPKSMTYLEFGTIDLVAGENSITLKQNNAGYRLVYGGEVRIHYAGDAKPVAGTPAPDAHKVTFVTPAHVKVLVYPGPVAGDPVEANVAYSRDDEGNYAKYVAPVADDPATEEDETVLEVKPEVNFKLQFEEGYYSDGNLMTISGTMGQEWNKLCCEDLDTYSITKLKGDITVTIAEEAGEEPNCFTANVTAEHCTVVFYQGAKNADGTNIDEGAAGKHDSMNKNGVVTRAKTQFNFEVFPETGYEFAHGLEKGSETSPAGISFVTGRNGHFPGYGNFKVDKKNVNLFSITKVATNLDINIVCTEIAA